MQAINITAYTEDASQIEAVKAFMKALKIKFEIANVKPYELSAEQQQILDSQINLDKNLYKDAETIYTDIKRSMSYKIVVSPIALKNIEEAVEYYVFKASKKVALDFLNDYKKVYRALQINPFCQFHDTTYRFLPFKKFPYIAFFIIDELSKTVFLNAVFHTSQNPEKYPTSGF